MKHSTAAALFLAIVLSFASMAGASPETFTSGADGWGTSLIDGTFSSRYQAPTVNSSGGNSGGYISSSVGNDVANRLYSIDSSSSPFGNLTGKTLTVDIKITGAVGTVAGASPAMARFYIGSDSTNYFVSTNAYSINLNNLSNNGSWGTFTVPVLSTNFMAWPGLGATSFADAAASGEWVGLVFTSADYSANNNAPGYLGLTSTGGAIVMMDNFGTPNPVPVPAGVWLLGSGLAGLVGIRKKRKRM
jgi:hypothetical protein